MITEEVTEQLSKRTPIDPLFLTIILFQNRGAFPAAIGQ